MTKKHDPAFSALDISYNIVVHKHRGNITVLSEPGRTCFQITLPIEGDLVGND